MKHEVGSGSAASRAIRRLAGAYSRSARRRRAAMFLAALPVSPGQKVLDLGSEDGAHIASLGLVADIYIADLGEEALQRGAARYGFTPVVIPESAGLPFPDGYFDVVFCSSVIEHVTVPKDRVRDVVSNQEFSRAAIVRQRALAEEIRRVGKRYFVQTPNRYFPIESHTWLPGIVVLLPRRAQIRLIDFMNAWWPKKTTPDFHLLSRREMQRLFPEATILRERSLGLTKSLIAVKA